MPDDYNPERRPMGVQSEQEVKLGFTIKDSGQRQSFDSGMVRDVATDKTDVELIFNGPMADRWAEHLTKGARKYPDPLPGQANWMRASGEQELVRFRKSAVRHFRQWLRGDVDEDHAAAVFFNINGYEYVKDRMTQEIEAESAEYRERRMGLSPLTESYFESYFEVEGDDEPLWDDRGNR